MKDSLTNRVAIVTGGGSGIGEAPCLELAHRGARVVVAGIKGVVVADIKGEEAGRVAAARIRSCHAICGPA